MHLNRIMAPKLRILFISKSASLQIRSSHLEFESIRNEACKCTPDHFCPNPVCLPRCCRRRQSAIAMPSCGHLGGSRKKIVLNTDEIFKVALEANAGSGYEWHLYSSDTDMIQLLEHKNIPQSDNNPDFVGGCYRDEWVFKILKKEKSQLRFDLFPPWEGPQADTKTVAVAIIVQQ